MLPLDERPCNYDFPYKLFQSEEISIVRPEQLGNKKEPADTEQIKSFLLRECEDAFGIILSIDMLLYGGLIPSRLHQEESTVLKQRLHTIRELKEMNPKLRIYAFQCIMRCPNYNENDEEPEYYDEYGEKLFRQGVLKHQCSLGMAEEKEWKLVRQEIPQEILTDYEARREINRELNLETIRFYQEGCH